MSGELEVPLLDDLRDLGVVVERSDQDGVVSATAWAGDGAVVTLTWDEIARSAHLRWVDGDHELVTIEREAAAKITVRAADGGVEFRLWSRSTELRGELRVSVGARVTIRDALLRG